MKQFQKIVIFMLLLSYINSSCTSFLDQTIKNLEDVQNSNNADDNTKIDPFDLLDLDDENLTDSNASSGNCHNRQFNTQFEKGAYRCCFVKGKCKEEADDGKQVTYDVNLCVALEKDAYDEIKKKSYEKDEDCEIEYDCNSSYLKLVFLSLIIFLL